MKKLNSFFTYFLFLINFLLLDQQIACSMDHKKHIKKLNKKYDLFSLGVVQSEDPLYEGDQKIETPLYQVVSKSPQFPENKPYVEKEGAIDKPAGSFED